jgi:hypothetical protein
VGALEDDDDDVYGDTGRTAYDRSLGLHDNKDDNDDDDDDDGNGGYSSHYRSSRRGAGKDAARKPKPRPPNAAAAAAALLSDASDVVLDGFTRATATLRLDSVCLQNCV